MTIFKRKKNVFTKNVSRILLEALSPSQDEPSLLGIINYEVCKSFLFALPIIPPIQETLGMCLLSEWMNWGSEWFMGPLYSRGLYCMCCLYFRACHVTLDITGIAASLSITKFYLLWNCANASQLSRWRCLLPQVRPSLFYSTWTIGGLLSEEQNWGWRDYSVVVTSSFRCDEYPVTSSGEHPGILAEQACHATRSCRRWSSTERYRFLIIPNFVLSIGEAPYWVWQEKGISLSHLFFLYYMSFYEG